MTKFVKTSDASATRSGRSTIRTPADYALVDDDGTVIANLRGNSGLWRINHLPSGQSALSTKLADAKTLALQIHDQFTKGEPK